MWDGGLNYSSFKIRATLTHTHTHTNLSLYSIIHTHMLVCIYECKVLVIINTKFTDELRKYWLIANFKVFFLINILKSQKLNWD